MPVNTYPMYTLCILADMANIENALSVKILIRQADDCGRLLRQLSHTNRLYIKPIQMLQWTMHSSKCEM